jgi:hypothetical protein
VAASENNIIKNNFISRLIMAKNQKYLLFGVLCAFLLALASSGYAYDVSKYLGEKRHLLEVDETVEQPSGTITVAGQQYLVVPVIYADALQTFMPIKFGKEELSTAKTINRSLFESEYMIRGYIKSQANASENSSPWYVNSTNARALHNLSLSLPDEIYQLDAIADNINDTEIESLISEMKSAIVSMSAKADDISQKMYEALDYEAKLKTDISPDDLASMKLAYKAAFAKTYELEDMAIDYQSNVSELKSKISASSLDTESKSNYISMASPPEGFEQISTWAAQASSLESVIDSIFGVSPTTIDSYLEEYDRRLKMDSAYEKIYGPNSDLQKLRNEYTSIAVAARYALSENVAGLWKNTKKAADLKTDWQRTERQYNNADYDLAMQSAESVKKDIETLEDDGFIVEEPEPLISQQTLLFAAGGLVALLVVLFIFQNRKKIMKKEEKSEKVDLYGWDKKI